MERDRALARSAILCLGLLLAALGANAQGAVSISKDIATQLNGFTEDMCGVGAGVLLDASTGRVTTAYAGAAGVRQHGKTTPCTINDAFYLGGQATASMINALVSVLVTAGKVRWTDTIGSILTKAKAPIPGVDPVNAARTLSDLMSDTLGVDGFNADDDNALVAQLQRKAVTPKDRTANRRAFAAAILKRPPITADRLQPGWTIKNYTTTDTVTGVAQYLVEVVSGQDLETLLQTYLFKPLNLTAWFGYPPSSVAKLDPQSCDDNLYQLVTEFTQLDPDWHLTAPYYVGLGSIWMHAGDLLRWNAWLLLGSKGLLSPDDYKIISKDNFAAYTYRSWNLWHPRSAPPSTVPFVYQNNYGFGTTSLVFAATKPNAKKQYLVTVHAINMQLGYAPGGGYCYQLPYYGMNNVLDILVKKNYGVTIPLDLLV